MTMSVSRYHEFDYWFYCWEILPGQVRNNLLLQCWLASVAGIWKERERGLGRERNKEEWSEGGSDFNIHLVDVHNAKNNSLLAGISLPSLVSLAPKTQFPFHLKCLRHRLSDLIQSFYSFTLVNIYQAICIFWWLEVKYILLLDHWMYFWYWRTKPGKMVTGKGNINSGTIGQ